jgi:spore coat polysaccharide biosynthesis predicted glycosyltransferase SpsG
VPEDCTLLLGPAFALLRAEFAELRKTTPVRDGIVRRALVSVGGADARNHTLKVVHAIARLDRRPAVDVVIAAEHGYRDEIEATCRGYGFECHVQPPHIAQLMARADLVVGAAGSTSWERCCLGTPTVCITDGENQVAIAAGLAAYGAVVNLRDGGAAEEAEIMRVLATLMADPLWLQRLSAASRELVDGQGTSRVCSAMGVA